MVKVEHGVLIPHSRSLADACANVSQSVVFLLSGCVPLNILEYFFHGSDVLARAIGILFRVGMFDMSGTAANIPTNITNRSGTTTEVPSEAPG
jgi:hypothetical protein